MINPTLDDADRPGGPWCWSARFLGISLGVEINGRLALGRHPHGEGEGQVVVSATS
ncbi:hypothetical protein ACRAWD_20570 [Caulobacter segnis]